MKQLILFLTSCSLLFLLAACEREPDFIPGQFDDQAKLISESELYAASYLVNEEQVKIVVEDLLNTSDNRTDDFPELDFLSIKMDINNNNLPDNDLDRSYAISSLGNPCMQFILQEGGAATGCIEELGFEYDVFFKSSSKNEADHIIYEFTFLREKLFSDSDTIGLIFIMSGEDGAGPIPFLFSPLFKETIEFSL